MSEKEKLTFDEIVRQGLEAIVGQLADIDASLLDLADAIREQTTKYDEMMKGADDMLGGLGNLFQQPKGAEEQ